MRIYVENPIETKSYWNVKSDFSKDMRYEISVQKSMVFLYTFNEKLEIEYLKISLTIVSKI